MPHCKQLAEALEWAAINHNYTLIRFLILTSLSVIEGHIIQVPAMCAGPRRVLHVQSISEWAPSCIGPYSQGVQLPKVTLFAGQIGLHPPTMDLLASTELQAQQIVESCDVSPSTEPSCLSSICQILVAPAKAHQILSCWALGQSACNCYKFIN